MEINIQGEWVFSQSNYHGRDIYAEEVRGLCRHVIDQFSLGLDSTLHCSSDRHSPSGLKHGYSARVISDLMPKELGQNVVVNNKPGASGIIAASSVARGGDDGTQWLIAPSTLFGAQHAIKDSMKQVKVMEDLRVVSVIAESPLLIVTHPSINVKTTQELVNYFKKNPGTPYATSGNGSPQHVAGEIFAKEQGVTLTHVPYKGVAPAIADTVGGQIHVAFTALGGIGAHIDAGRLNAIAVAQKDRSPLIPKVPTLAEEGVNNVEMKIFFTLMVPSKTPDAAVQRINQAMASILKSNELKARMEALGVQVKNYSFDESKKWRSTNTINMKKLSVS